MLLPTVKEDPAGAEAISHKLMVRAGLVRQLAAGIYVFLPVGWRVMQKVAGIIREEMNAIGGQELLMPVVNPADIWIESGRWSAIGEELFRFKDRKGADMALAMTHEEVVTWLAAREVHSYKQLPQIWYHIQTKERDEARPKSGLLRVREFLMKDSYTLDASVEALQESYRKHIMAYDRIYRRCGLEFMMVEGDSGIMGGEISHEYMAFSEAGEDEIVFCEGCDYASNVETALGRPGPLDEASAVADKSAAVPISLPAEDALASERLREVPTPETRTIEQVTAYVGLPARRFIKSLVVVTEDRGAVMVMVRGDHELHEAKLRRVVGEFRMATAEEVDAALGAPAGFVGPVKLVNGAPQPIGLPLLADEALRAGVYVAGANRDQHHLAGVAPADFVADYHDLRVVRAGDGCPRCEGILRGARAIEVGNIFQLGTKYSKPMKATYLDEQGVEHEIVMGSYGIGLARVAAAAVEQHHDKDGIVWPASIAPFDVQLVLVKTDDATQRELAERLYAELTAPRLAGGRERAGEANDFEHDQAAAAARPAAPKPILEVLFDDRDLSPGVKFKDADLLGCPLQIVVGKRAAEGVVEVKQRATGERVEMAADAVAGYARGVLAQLLAALS
jgi:prolyl-tRNA synthetase